jgi:hypothetical protein
MNENTNEIAKQPETSAAIAPSANPVPTALQQRIDRLYTDEKLDLLFMTKAEIMAKSHILPPLFQGDVYACYSLQRIAFQWQTDPTLLAPGIYKATANAPLSLDGKTVKSVIDRFAPVKDHFIADEYFGDWDKILGKFETRQSKKLDDYGNPKTYKVPAWRPEDEQGLGIRLTATLNNGHTVTYELKLTQCLTRNSTLWAEDPQLQIYYRAIARFSRKYFPYILNGMYIKEEIMDADVIDITPAAESVTATAEPQTDGKAKKRKSNAEKLAEKFGVQAQTAPVDAEEVAAPVDDLLNQASVNYAPQSVTERIEQAIAETQAPITIAEVDMFLANLGALNGYTRDELDKYPENIRNRMNGENGIKNLVNKTAEWILNK